MTSSSSAGDTDATDATDVVDKVFARAQAAQAAFSAPADQALLDRAADAAAWAVMHPDRNRELSNQAVAATGLGRAEDKIAKNHRKTLGLLRDLKGRRTCGIVAEDRERGITEIMRPVGVVAAVVPSTNPVATTVNNVINALKCGNAIIVSPSPSAVAVVERLAEHIRAELTRAALPDDLVQVVPGSPSKAKTARLMTLADLVVATGSQANVRAAYSSGTPAIGVGRGNVVCIIDETADLSDAAKKIAASKCFDNATSCSSENVLIIVKKVYPAAIKALEKEGGRMLSPAQAEKLVKTHWKNGALNRETICVGADRIMAAADLTLENPDSVRFLLAPLEGTGPDYPLSGEKMAVIAGVLKADDFDQALVLAGRVLAYQGAGHSAGLHSASQERARQMGLTLPVCRVIFNQAHCFAAGGSFDNGLPFSLSMGCGTWGGNSIDGNLTWRHFVNRVRVVCPVAAQEPEMDSLLGGYWADVGR